MFCVNIVQEFNFKTNFYEVLIKFIYDIVSMNTSPR